MRRIFSWTFLIVGLVVLAVGACSDEPVSPCGDPCPSGRRCDSKTGRCVPRTTCTACEFTAECENNQVCQDGCCVAGGTGTETTTESTSGDASVNPEPSSDSAPCPNPPCNATCTTDADCTNGTQSKCDTNKGVCVSCLVDTDCATGETCQNGNCEKPVDKCTGVTCDPGKVCEPATGSCIDPCPATPCKGNTCCNDAGQCVACGNKGTCEPCKEHPECGAKARCASLGSGDKSCIPTCPDDQCPTGFSCLSLGSKLGKLCIPDAVCKPVNKCENVTCTGAKKCCPKTGNCRTCCANSECPAGQRCIEGGNDAQCGVDPNACKPACKAGETCNAQTGKCEKSCVTAGCPDQTTKCDTVSGVCVKKDCRSNWTCTGNTTCNRLNGQCEAIKDCRQQPNLCTGTTCCSTTTGKCVTDCRQCGFKCKVSGQTCNRTTGRCEVNTCKFDRKCSNDRDCCGLKCEFSVGHLDKRCRCKSSTDCPAPYRCKSSVLNKYCE